MMHTDEKGHEQHDSWQHLGRAAEHLARRVARDARRFAARMEHHVGEFADDVRREWRCGAGADRRSRPEGGEEVRRVFEDVRGILAAVLDGVDELISDVFAGRGDDAWTRVVSNLDTSCEGCGNPIAAGSAAHVRGRGGARRFRCVECGPPKDAPAA